MKKVLLSSLLVMSLLAGCKSTDPVVIEETADTKATTESETPKSTRAPAPEALAIDISKLLPVKYKKPANPDAEQLAIIRYVLMHTNEVNIHQMRGETENRVFVNEDGREAVYDKDGQLVTNSYNQGTYNFYSNETEPIKKFIYDTAPWLKFGSSSDDPTSFTERLYHYTLDLDIGIQDYIFFGSKETLETVSFEELTDDEKEVYYLFLQLLFNDKYAVALSDDNIQQLRDDGDFYFEYFDQIQDVLNVSENPEPADKETDAPAAPGQSTTDQEPPIDFTVVSYDNDINWTPVMYEHEQYRFEMPENWQVTDGTKYGLRNGVFLLPPETNPDDFLYSAHVALEVTEPFTLSGETPDYSSEAFQKEFFALQIIQTYAKMGGLSDLTFSVWEADHSYVYMADFKRSNAQLSMYQTTYYVMLPDKMLYVQATHFGENAVPEVHEAARYLINTFE